MISIRPVVTDEELQGIKELFREYEQSLGFDLGFQDFETELKALPGDYAPPDGGLLLAYCDHHIAGCCALRKLQPTICEMKRLYIKPQYRSRHMGRKLVAEIIAKAHEIGYAKMRLDTIPAMISAQKLYESFGFKNIQPYCHNPISGTRFMELSL